MNTPLSLGYHMPAEWEPQEAVWLSWPHNKKFWGDDIPIVENIYAQFMSALQDGQRIRVLVKNKSMARRARGIIQAEGVLEERVDFFQIPTQEIYIRDYGPTFLVNQKTKEKAIVNWKFNAWGGKYPSSLSDDAVPGIMNQYLNLPAFGPGIILEGGSIDVNGAGTVLVTEQCLLNDNRNPHLDRTEIKEYLRDYLGVSNILWLGKGLFGDDTDGHIDDIARFVNPTTVVCAYEQDHNDLNYARLKENYERLKRMKDQNRRPLEIVKLPMAKVESLEHNWTGSNRKPASYCNFYIGNSAVVVPTFGQDNDSEALRIMQKYFSDRKVIGIESTRMVLDGGTLHCASQQEPKTP